MTNPPKEWHREVISDATDATMRILQEATLLDHFYLAGGTGLALQFGHRLSNDLDFFADFLFSEESLLQRVERIVGFSLASKEPHTLHAAIQDTKVSFLGYAYPLLHPCGQFEKVAVADPRDIACMKLSAIASRGTRRDFVDFYICVQAFGLPEILRMFDRKYASTAFNKLHILKSLTFFDDAEKDPMPHLLMPFDWDEAKQFFLHEVPRLA